VRRLNLAEVRSVRIEPAVQRRLHEVTFGGEHVFLDPGTLSAFAAESDAERPPVLPCAEPVFPPPRPSGGPSAVCLSITHTCNLACRYCYVRARSPAPATMSRETARGALSLLRPPGPWRIGFFGGEPMLAWDLLRDVVGLARDRAEREGARVRFSITTNGTLLTSERAEFLKTHGFSLIVSLDGPRELHDAERVTPDGEDSFDRVIAGLRAGDAAGLGASTTLRSTFPLERPELVARLEFLNELADEGLARAVSVEPAWPPTSVRGPVSFSALPSEYVAAASWTAGRMEAGHRTRFHHIEKALERILLMRPAGTECGAGFGYVEVSPSGEIHACHKAAGGVIGRVEKGVSEHRRAPWLENRWYARARCRECWARNVCGGGCRAEALSHVGSVARVWPVACAVKKAQVGAALYVAAACSREKLSAQLGPRTRRPRRGSLVPVAGA
jgi:uncharacterized protein